jgi:hypothetical protein
MKLIGQMTLYFLLALFIDLLLFAFLSPLFVFAVDQIYTSLDPSDTVSQFLTLMIIPMILFGFIFMILVFADPLKYMKG